MDYVDKDSVSSWQFRQPLFLSQELEAISTVKGRPPAIELRPNDYADDAKRAFGQLVLDLTI